MNPEDDKYLQEAKEAFARMSPEGRVRFGRYLGEKAQQQGHTFIDLNQDGIDDRLQDPTFLAHKTNQVRKEQPGLLRQLFGKRHRRYSSSGSGTHRVYVSDPFEREERSETDEADRGFFESLFGGDFFGGDSSDSDSSGGDSSDGDSSDGDSSDGGSSDGDSSGGD